MDVEAKEFCLKWNSFMDVFQGTFAKLLNKEHFVDVSLACDGETIKCHKVVLSACSNYFQSLLLENQHPHPLIILRDVPAKDMQALIRFMYTGEVTVAQSQLNSLIRVADLLKIKGLADTDSESKKRELQVEQPQPATPPVKVEGPYSSQFSDTTRTPPLKRKRTKPPPPPLVERTAVPASVPLPLPHEVPQGSPGIPDSELQSHQSHNSSEPALSPRENPITPNTEEGNNSLKDFKPKQDLSGMDDDGEDNSNQFDEGGEEYDFKPDGSIIGNGDEAGSSTSLNHSGLALFPVEEFYADASEMEVENAKIYQLMQSPDFRRMPKHLQDAVFAVVRGMSFNEASRIYKTSSVRLVAKRFGVESSTKRHSFFQGKQYTTESIEQALEAVKSGQQSLCSASRSFNIPFATLQVVAKKRGIKSQFRKVENKVDKQVESKMVVPGVLYQFGSVDSKMIVPEVLYQFGQP